MRTPLSVLLCLLLLLGPAAAEEESKQQPAKPPTPDQAADVVLEAVKAKDRAALKALAARDEPDPWIVADALCLRRAYDAAGAFAEAAPRRAVEKLPAYVARRRGRDRDAQMCKTYGLVRAAVDAQAWAKGVAAAETWKGPLDDVASVHLAHLHGTALAELHRFEESAARSLQAAEAAQRLGWFAGAARALHQSGSSSFKLPDAPKALAAYGRALGLYQLLDDKAAAAGTLIDIGLQHGRLSKYTECLEAYATAKKRFEELGDERGVARAVAASGFIRLRLGQFTEAMEAYQRALEVSRAHDDQVGIAKALRGMGMVHERLGDYALAFDHWQRGLEAALRGGDRQIEALARLSLAVGQYRMGALPDARDSFEHVLAIMRETGDRSSEAVVLGNLGAVYYKIGDLPRALELQKRALKMKREFGHLHGVAATLHNLGNVHLSLGNYPEALSLYHRSLKTKHALGDQRGVAMSLGNVGLIHARLGNFEKALASQRRSLEISEALGDKSGVAETLHNIGTIHARRGDYPKAAVFYQRALDIDRKLGHERGEVETLGALGSALQSAGEYEEALSFFKRAFELAEAHGQKTLAVRALGVMGYVQVLLGKQDEGTKKLKRAVRQASRLRATPLLVNALSMLARVHLMAGDHAEALRRAESGRRELELLLGGLGEEEGATARARHADIFAIGTLAAARLDEPAEALAFLESGRAGALLESLGGRQALRWTDLPKELSEAQAEATAVETRARHVYERALGTGKRVDVRVASTALDEARDGLRAIAARIQRAAKKQAGLFYPRAATMEEVQDQLAEGQALVVYGLCVDELLALVLRREGEQTVMLGKVSEMTQACEALDISKPTAECESALGTLRKLLVDPLKLKPDVKLVLISPDGALGYVPFGALFDRAVAFTPSGTTHALLKQEGRREAQGVLALGDPDYGGVSEGASAVYVRGATLASLPGTLAEVRAVGDVVLLGKAANESGLRDALTGRPRWRAVHLACHGLVDPERPTLSSLALSRTKQDDGFLTALEVLRMEIPADLAVLSACETGKGKIVRGEGIVGLTRAFMYAGAPRILCSLWKVDDAATQALMIKFYELWNPKEGKGIGAAAALKQAQEFIRGHDKWKHPYYWAAWVLWGLPD